MKKFKDFLIIGIKLWIALWVLSADSFNVMTSSYVMDVPIVKYFFTVLEALDGWGIETLFMALGLGGIFYIVRDNQKNTCVSCLSVFFAVCTVIGISYENTGSLDFIFLYGLQFLLAIFVAAGYYLLYKNSILFIIYVFKKWANIFRRREPVGRLELFFFQEHTFWGPFLLFLILGLPWLVSYFPGTLHWDAFNQLRKSLGNLPMDGHHPVLISEYMGFCIQLGRALLRSDSFGFFLYTGPQFLCQCLVFSYACHVMSKKRVPVLICWGALLYWGLHPLLPIWGFTMAKDSMSYISISLLTAVLVEICCDGNDKVMGYQAALFLASIAGITLFRHDGKYVIMFTVICGILLYKKYWKLFLGGTLVCLLLIGIERQYMVYHQIPAGEVGEMLSLPLQQTARYLRDHYDEVTEEEAEVLQRGFTASLNQIASSYNPDISDPVKGSFVAHPDAVYLKEYFSVWFHQMLKHPDTYIQAFLNQTYGYFYPNKHNWEEGYSAVFDIVGTEYLQTDYLDIHFGLKASSMRRILQNTVYVIVKTPVLGLLLSAGMYVYVFIGEMVYLLVKKKRREFIILTPGFAVLLICLLSPVNGYLRYLLPIIAAMPITIGGCCAAGSNAPVMKE